MSRVQSTYGCRESTVCCVGFVVVHCFASCPTSSTSPSCGTLSEVIHPRRQPIQPLSDQPPPLQTIPDPPQQPVRPKPCQPICGSADCGCTTATPSPPTYTCPTTSCGLIENPSAWDLTAGKSRATAATVGELPMTTRPGAGERRTTRSSCSTVLMPCTCKRRLAGVDDVEGSSGRVWFDPPGEEVGTGELWGLHAVEESRPTIRS
jgi:hypothetical protein